MQGIEKDKSSECYSKKILSGRNGMMGVANCTLFHIFMYNCQFDLSNSDFGTSKYYSDTPARFQGLGYLK